VLFLLGLFLDREEFRAILGLEDRDDPRVQTERLEQIELHPAGSCSREGRLTCAWMGLNSKTKYHDFPHFTNIFQNPSKKIVPRRGPNDITEIGMHEKRTEKGKEGENWKGG